MTGLSEGRRRGRIGLALSAAAVLVAACGGGGGGGGGDAPAAPAGDPVVAQKCSPNNPFRGDAEGPTTAGSLADEKRWLRSYFDQAYLWYAEVPAVDASAAAYSVDTGAGYYRSIDNYFEALKTPALVAGTTRRKDPFSFTYPTALWNQLAQNGVSAGYGIEWSHVTANPTWSGLAIAYVEPGSPAASLGLRRGDRLVSVDGVPAEGAPYETLLRPLFPSVLGEAHSFVFRRSASTLPPASLTSAAITKTPVPLSRTFNVGGRTVGYLVFNDHIATAEAPLAAAIDGFRAAGATELVLDLRYNGGGYLYLASQLAYMIAGATPTAGKLFERLQYNDKRSAESNAPGSSLGFFNVSCNLNANLACTTQNPLPSLGFSRVTVLASGSTCSASESIVNGLRGIDIDVRLVGSATCGKPYGFTARDNCGVSYFPIEFQGVNQKGQGDYAGGFAPSCTVADDLDHPLGDPAEGQLATALALIDTGACPVGSGKPANPIAKAGRPEPLLARHVTRESRIDLPSVRPGPAR
ncbi:MAG TPA: S41 family peptidase [Methylibium sp.]|uniref:S41 family peptidase n=1 Tax=Methylibium sp. TaxID=2067992 RepID=UPI002DBFAD9D|nr:S41 family peptidase [Methylibium sp.]HEU4459485.1 S41 family peptidase [Methylibium sp.]